MKENFNSLGVHAQEQKNKERETHAVYFKNAKNIGNYFQGAFFLFTKGKCKSA